MTDLSLSPEEQALLIKIRFATEVEAWIGTSVGQYLFDRANDEIDEAAHGLLDVNPTDHAAIVELQVKGRAAHNLKVWLMEAVSDGIEAERELDASPE
jgi:hypothetical protein